VDRQVDGLVPAATTRRRGKADAVGWMGGWTFVGEVLDPLSSKCSMDDSSCRHSGPFFTQFVQLGGWMGEEFPLASRGGEQKTAAI